MSAPLRKEQVVQGLGSLGGSGPPHHPHPLKGVVGCGAGPQSADAESEGGATPCPGEWWQRLPAAFALACAAIDQRTPCRCDRHARTPLERQGRERNASILHARLVPGYSRQADTPFYSEQLKRHLTQDEVIAVVLDEREAAERGRTMAWAAEVFSADRFGLRDAFIGTTLGMEHRPRTQTMASPTYSPPEVSRLGDRDLYGTWWASEGELRTYFTQTAKRRADTSMDSYAMTRARRRLERRGITTYFSETDR